MTKTPDSTDLTVVLTAHDETLVAGPTIAAADAAIAAAEAAGITVERIITLDNPTPECAAWFGQPALDHWDRRTVSHGDIGRVRNAILPETRGRFIAFLDADDLYSRNWLREGVLRLRVAEAKGQKAIAHPELNWLFDATHSVFWKPDQDDPLFSPWHFYFMNYYDSLCMAPRAAYLDFPYADRDLKTGLAFQDWQFSVETMDAGWVHLNAPNTIIFKRRRDASLVTESRSRRVLVRAPEAMAIDRIDALGRTPPQRQTKQVTQTKRAKLLDRLMGAKPDGSHSGGGTGSNDSNGGGKTGPVPLPQTTDVTTLKGAAFGPGFAARVARAKARRGQVRDTAVYDAIAPAFDHAYYLAANRDISALEDVDPIAHYIRAGWREGRNPAPWFSTADYLARHPDLETAGTNPFYHWLTKGRHAGHVPRPTCDFDAVAETIGLSPDAAFAHWQARYEDLRARLATGTLGAEVNAAAQIEPLIAQGWPDALALKLPPFHSDNVTRRTAAIWQIAKSAECARARHVICVGRARFGGAPRMEGHIARALAERDGPDSVLILITDHTGAMPEGKLPKGVRVVDFAAQAQGIIADPRQRLLVETLRALRPETVTGVNSRLFWDMLPSYGVAISQHIRLYACLLCNEQTAMGYWTGYPLRRTYRHFDLLSALFTDSHALAGELRSRYMLPAEQAGRICVLSNPVDPAIALAPAPAAHPARRPQVFWAGRMDAQKRVDLAYAIARACPEADFRLWGEAVMGAHDPGAAPQNLTLEGTYARFTDLPLDQADMWLYTAAWDGVPTMLLEAAMAGIPLVGSDVGGTAEVLRAPHATALGPDAGPEDYAAALRAGFADPDTARKQARALRDLLAGERSAASHAQALYAGLGLT